MRISLTNTFIAPLRTQNKYIIVYTNALRRKKNALHLLKNTNNTKFCRSIKYYIIMIMKRIHLILYNIIYYYYIILLYNTQLCIQIKIRKRDWRLRVLWILYCFALFCLDGLFGLFSTSKLRSIAESSC